MRQIIQKHIVSVLVFLTFQLAISQQTVQLAINDTIQLHANTFRGNIQWQTSQDNQEWNNIAYATDSTYSAIITILPSYYRAEITEENCPLIYSETITVIGNDALLWSEESTWDGQGKPQAGDEVIIPSDKYILLDESPPALGGLTIQGALKFDDQDLELTSEWIVINGVLKIGSENQPHQHKAIITLNDNDTEASQMGMGTRGIMVMGGTLDLHGEVPNTTWTKIDDHAQAGSNSVTLIEAVDWNIEDEIVIAPTDYYEAGYGASITQKTEISSITGNQISLSDNLNAFRWGKLQYPSSNGMSLSSGNIVQPPVPNTENTFTPLVLDERAEVGNLTRNIVIQAPNDNLWNQQGFGAHTMIMPNALAQVEGVEFRRVGQRGRLRRYPFHWHMLSYSGSQTLPDATGQYFKGNTINVSANRGIVIHGTNGVLVQNNIVYNVRGHGVFTEDAVERRNIIDNNLVLHIRNPLNGYQLKEHERGVFGSSGFWISNPDNIVTNNTVADSQTFGFWLAFPEQPFGSSQNVLAEDGLILRPNRLLFGEFDNNTAHSNKNDGIHLDDPEIDNDGNTFPKQYWSTTDGRTDGPPFDALRRFSLSRYKTWKNQDNGAWDRGVWTDIFEVVSADNCGRFFAGSGADGIIERSLVVGTSLNFMMNGTGRPAQADFQFFNSSSAPTAFATYHGAFGMRNNIVVNFQVTENDRSGVFATDDYYLRPVEKSLFKNHNNLLIESHPGVKLPSPQSYFSLAGALWDPYGFWGPEGNFIVYNTPFLTYGKDITNIEPNTEITGGVSVSGPFYGFLSFVLHGVGTEPPQNMPRFDLMAIHVNRYDPNNLTIPVGSWDVASAQPNWALQHMRDFATSPDGIYELTFPDETVPPTNFQMEVENMLDESDLQVIAIEYDGNLDPIVQIQQLSNVNNWTLYNELNSLQQVMDSGGETWWQDKPNNRVWLKIKGGRWQATNSDENNFEAITNETMLIKIREL